MASIQSSTDPRVAKPEVGLRERLTRMLAGGLQHLETPERLRRYPDAARTGAEILMPAFENIPGIAQGVSAEDFGAAREKGDWLGMGLAALGMIPGGRAEKSLADEAVVGREALAKVKKPTKKELELAAKKEQLNRTIETRGLTPGENRMPFVNPSEAELAAIRAQHGEGGMVRKEGDLFHGSSGEDGTPPYVDASQTNYLFPEPSARTREQRPLPRKVTDMTPRVEAMLANPAVEKAIREAAEAGRDVQSWYDTTPLQQKFIEEFGQEEGMQRFSDFMLMVAGTSTGNKIGNNLKMASNYYAQKYGAGRNAAIEPYIRRQDTQVALNKPTKDPADRLWGPKHEDVPQAYELPPTGYGHDKQQTHMFNINQLEGTGELSSFENPKIAAFYENLMGNWAPATIDKHATRLMAMASKDPRWLTEQGAKSYSSLMDAGLDEGAVMEQLLKTPTNWQDIPGRNAAEYAALEDVWKKIAGEMGVTPAELQAMAWVGGGRQTGLGSAPVTFMDAFSDRIRRTSIRDNIPPEQVLQLMMQGKLTLAQLEDAQGTSAIG